MSPLFDHPPIDRCPICQRYAPWSPLDPRDGYDRWAVACVTHRPVVHLPPSTAPAAADATILGEK